MCAEARHRKMEEEGLIFATCFRAQNMDRRGRHFTMSASLCVPFLCPESRLTFATVFWVGGADCHGTMLRANRVARSRVGEFRRKAASSWRRLCKLCALRRACASTTHSKATRTPAGRADVLAIVVVGQNEPISRGRDFDDLMVVSVYGCSYPSYPTRQLLCKLRALRLACATTNQAKSHM